VAYIFSWSGTFPLTGVTVTLPCSWYIEFNIATQVDSLRTVVSQNTLESLIPIPVKDNRGDSIPSESKTTSAIHRPNQPQ